MRLEYFTGSNIMAEEKNRPDGIFSRGLLSLRLQMESLLDISGGADAADFLDNLSTLTPSEQKLALKLFSSTIEQIKAGNQRLSSMQDQELKDLEDGLFNDILSSMREAANASPPQRQRIQVLDGGKAREKAANTPINLEEARKSRRLKPRDLIN